MNYTEIEQWLAWTKQVVMLLRPGEPLFDPSQPHSAAAVHTIGYERMVCELQTSIKLPK